jgi:hypothetical protein
MPKLQIAIPTIAGGNHRSVVEMTVMETFVAKTPAEGSLWTT